MHESRKGPGGVAPGEDEPSAPPRDAPDDPARVVSPPAEAAAEAELAAEVALDHALIRGAQAGEEAAFESLVRRHQQRAWRVARNLVPSDEDAQDLAQEAFVRVFKSLASFDFQHGFTTWLYRIVTNLAIDHLRRRRPASSTTRSDDDESDLDIVDARMVAPSQRLESAELSDEVKATLSGLAPHFQSVLVLREMEGLPCNEIARIVGATHVTVRWRLHRGRKLFQEEWERRSRLREAGGDPKDSVRSANADADSDVHDAGNEGER